MVHAIFGQWLTDCFREYLHEPVSTMAIILWVYIISEQSRFQNYVQILA